MKVKIRQEGRFLVGGVARGTGWREATFGSLMLEERNGDGGTALCGLSPSLQT